MTSEDIKHQFIIIITSGWVIMLDYVIGCRLSLWRSGRGRVCVRTRVCLCACVVCNCKVCLCVVGGDVCVCAHERAYASAPACLTSTRTSWQRGPSDEFGALLTRQVLGAFQRRQLNAFPAPACYYTVPLNTHSVHCALYSPPQHTLCALCTIQSPSTHTVCTVHWAANIHTIPCHSPPPPPSPPLLLPIWGVGHP